MRPRIGITTSLNEGEQRLTRQYVLAVEAAGGLPMPAPMVETESASAEFASLLDGLVITGGPAITDGLVGALPNDIDETDPARVASDLYLLDYALERGLPLLGICYGMQLINARAGGTLYADVQAQHPGCDVHSQKRGGTTHAVHAEPDTLFARLMTGADLRVNTRHIQAIAEVGEGYRVSARAPDGVIEAVERPDGRVIGVQFHPERMEAEGAPLFRHLVQEAARFRELTPPLSA